MTMEELDKVHGRAWDDVDVSKSFGAGASSRELTVDSTERQVHPDPQRI